MNILLYPNKNLNKKSKLIKYFFLKKIFFYIYEIRNILLLNENYLALSGIQIGLKKRFFLMKYKKKILTFINPVILWSSKKKEKFIESCISIPNFSVIKERSKYIIIKYKNEEFYERIFFARNIFSSCIQHEIDHMNGILINNY
ncbi:peptide deformylase [Candidatus Vidania fulgoroideorum]